MVKSQLSKKDYEKILEFITQVQNIKTNFRSTTLKNLSDFFGYNHLTFFLADNNGHFIDPVVTNINPDSIKTYINYYHSTDIFYALKEPNSTFKKNVITITDIMTYRQFENTEYYRDFLRLDNLYYEIAVPLILGNNLLGGIGVFNPKESGNFTSKDVLILEKLSRFISGSLNNYIQVNQLSYQEKLLENMTSQCPIGLVVLNSNHSIIYSNNIAKDFCLDILNDKSCLNPIEHVMNKLFMECNYRQTDSYPFLCRSIDNYKFKITSSIVSNAFTGLEPVIHIYITKEIKSNNRTLNDIASSYNLTNREVEIITLVSKGLSNKEISQSLFISYHTVKTHMENIFKKLQVDNRASLIYKINNNIQ